jgi:CRISPR-associated protein Cmr2
MTAMPRYLIALAVGPVQDFIAAARRSRDLWFGSYLLSEVSKAAALSLSQAPNANLIFPSPLNLKDDLEEGSDFNVGNKLLVEVDTADPAAVARQAKDAAQHRWGELAAEALYELKKKGTQFNTGFHVRQDLWDDQRQDFLELYAAWVPLDGQDHSKARHRVDALLAARKNTRDFQPAKNPDIAYGIPKSSLDGKRESVLPDEKLLPKWAKRKLWLNPGEQLDCPGVVKRLGTSAVDAEEKFTSVSRIALDPWLRRIEDKQPGRLQRDLHAFFEDLVRADDGLASRVRGNRDADGHSIYADLPYDGQMLYPFRLEAQLNALRRESVENSTQQHQDAAIKRLEALRDKVRPVRRDAGDREKGLWDAYGEPNPYVAVLQADGDRMGELLDSLEGAEPLQQVSRALTKFAMAVPSIVRDHRGHCIYSGGDDVLALVPLDQVVACARRLHDRFGAMKLPPSKTKPTLSVGIGVGHLIEPMGYLLDLARQAEKLAKGERHQRDGLAIILEPRSGARFQMRDQWDNQPDQRLAGWMAAFQQDRIPDKAPYELRELARELDWAEAGLVKAEARRILARKRAGSGTHPIDPPLLETLLDAAQRPGPTPDAPRFDLPGLVDEMLIARRLSKSAPQEDRPHDHLSD